MTNTQAWHLLRAEEQRLLQDALRVGGAHCTGLVQERECALHETFGRHAELRVTRPDRASFRRALEGFHHGYCEFIHPNTLAEMEAFRQAPPSRLG